MASCEPLIHQDREPYFSSTALRTASSTPNLGHQQSNPSAPAADLICQNAGAGDGGSKARRRQAPRARSLAVGAGELIQWFRLRPFGSTRSQVRILSPRLTFQGLANFAGAERELGGLLQALKTVARPSVFFSPRRAIKAEFPAKEENAVPYSFRHSCSLREHQRGIAAGSVAMSMGHSFEVHCRASPGPARRELLLHLNEPRLRSWISL